VALVNEIEFKMIAKRNGYKKINLANNDFPEGNGFTLVEVLVALAISASAVLVTSSALFNVLRMETSAMRKSEAVLMLRAIECMEFANAVPFENDARAQEGWAVLEHRFEEKGQTWKAWQITPDDRKSITWSVFFSRSSDPLTHN